MYEYEKTMLYVYPNARVLNALYAELADGKIKRSVLADGNTEKLVGEILACIEIQNAISRLVEMTDDALVYFTEEEKHIMEYRFFRRKKYLVEKYGEYKFNFSRSGFYRKSAEILKKFSSIIKNQGYTEKKFMEDFSGSDLIMKVYYKVKAKKDSYIFMGRDVEMNFAERQSS